MDWEDPGYTLILLLVFLYVTLFVNSEYALSVPLFFIVAVMTKAWLYRQSGGFKKNIIENGTVVQCAPYRPFAYLRVAVSDFKHFSRIYPSPRYTKISYVRHSLEPVLGNKVRSGKTSRMEHTEFPIALVPLSQQSNVETASTTGSRTGISQLLSTLNLIKTDNMKDGLLQNASDPWVRSESNDIVDISYVYPILAEDYCDIKIQNIDSSFSDGNEKLSGTSVPESKTNLKSKSDNLDHYENASTTNNKGKFQPWDQVDSDIKFTFFGDSPEHSFVDSSLGTITVPLRSLLCSGSEKLHGLQPEFTSWVPIKWNSSFDSHVQVYFLHLPVVCFQY